MVGIKWYCESPGISPGLICGERLFQNIQFTSFIRLWSYQWGILCNCWRRPYLFIMQWKILILENIQNEALEQMNMEKGTRVYYVLLHQLT